MGQTKRFWEIRTDLGAEGVHGRRCHRNKGRQMGEERKASPQTT